MLNTSRTAMHAGEWYTDDPKKLDEELSLYMTNAKPDVKGIKTVKGLIGPHAGYYFSGPTAAWSYKLLKNQHSKEEPLRVFLLGPSHHIYIDGCGLTLMEKYETPLGAIEIDREITEQLKQKGRFRYLEMDDEEDEHSLEMHLPYIRKTLGANIKLIPIMVGACNLQTQEEYANILLPYFQQSNTLFIISSDFCHWGERFEYTYCSEGMQIWQSIERMDGQGMNLIQTHDPKGFDQYIRGSQNTICGRHPIGIYLNILKLSSLSCKTKFVKYAQSEQVRSLHQSSVSYASAITYIPG